MIQVCTITVGFLAPKQPQQLKLLVFFQHVSPDKKSHISFRNTISGNMAFASSLPFSLQLRPPYDKFTVVWQFFMLSSLSEIHLFFFFLGSEIRRQLVIAVATTPVSSVFLLESLSDTMQRGDHNGTIPVIDASRKAFWDAMFSHIKKENSFVSTNKNK